MRSLRLYQKLYLIRKSEEAIIERYMDDEMKTPMHLSIGQEAISAAVIESLTKSDQVVGTYRSHGIYLAKTLETDKFFAELYGRSTGSSKGKAGSMHLSSAEHGYLGSSAIVATHLPVALGAAMANKIKGNDNHRRGLRPRPTGARSAPVVMVVVSFDFIDFLCVFLGFRQSLYP